MGAEKSIEFEYEGKKVKFTIKRLSYGQYQKAVASATSMDLLGNVAKGKIDSTKMIDEMMKSCVSGEMDYHLLDAVDGIKLQEEMMKFNGLGGEGNFRGADGQG